ncbi:MAG: NADP-dependent oxidoreductase [Panacagrimonas sp.]
MQNRQWILTRRPVGDIRDGDLVFQTNPIPKPKKGEVVVKNEWLSLDPTNRLWMSDMDQYMPPVLLGAPMRGFVVGKVVDSASDAFPVGSYATGLGSWSDYSCEPAAMLSPTPEVPGISRKDVFGQFGIVGPTAYFGLLEIGAPKIGETLVVSGAAGAVGSIAVQLGKVWGCKVVAIAGGKDKCDWIRNDLGADQVIDYKSQDVDKSLRGLCPEGIDIYFDNVGGDTLNAAMGQMNMYGRIIQCGMIAVYNKDGHDAAPSNYPRILMKRLKVQGFIVIDYAARYPEAIRALAKLHLEGRLKWRHHELEGLEQADKAVRMLYTGGNTGKLMIKIADPS